MMLPTWSTRLHTWLRLVMGRPFAWGETNCGMLCLSAVDAMCGTAIAPQYAARCRSRFAAQRLQVQHGINVETALRRHIEISRVSDNLVRRGDLVLHPAGLMLAGHVVFGELCVSAPEGGVVSWFRTREALAQTGAFILRISPCPQ